MEELVSKKKLITIVGAGYVGMSLSVLLGKDNNHVKILEIDENKVQQINDGFSTVKDDMSERTSTTTALVNILDRKSVV